MAKTAKKHILKDLGPIWSVIFIIVFACLLTGAIVNFVNKVHYTNMLLGLQHKANSAQNQLNSEKYDVSFIIKNYGNSINCYDLRSTYARDLCNQHNQGS